MIERSHQSRPALLVIAYLGFISLGLPDTLIGVAWPSVRDGFARPQNAVAVLFFGVGLSYFLSSFFTGRLLGVFGIGSLLAVSSGLVALSGFGYALAPVWAAFALCSVLHGLGSGAIDAGLNHFVAHHFSARHMTWLHACYTLGATLGPLVMTVAVAERGAWRAGYLAVALGLLALALLFAITRRKWDAPDGALDAEPPAVVGLGSALRHPVVRLQGVLFFFYTGLEATAGQWSYTLLTEARHISRETAGLWVTAYWGSIFAGRVLSGFFVERVGINRVLRASTIAAFAGTMLLAWNPAPFASLAALVLTGLGLASIFPSLMTRTPQRLGPALTTHAIGFQVSAAILGAAALPSAAGALAQKCGLETVAAATVGMAAVGWWLHEKLLGKSARSSSAPATAQK